MLIDFNEAIEQVPLVHSDSFDDIPPIAPLVRDSGRNTLFRYGATTPRPSLSQPVFNFFQNAVDLSYPVIPGQRALTLEEALNRASRSSALNVMTSNVIPDYSTLPPEIDFSNRPRPQGARQVASPKPGENQPRYYYYYYW